MGLFPEMKVLPEHLHGQKLLYLQHFCYSLAESECQTHQYKTAIVGSCRQDLSADLSPYLQDTRQSNLFLIEFLLRWAIIILLSFSLPTKLKLSAKEFNLELYCFDTFILFLEFSDSQLKLSYKWLAKDPPKIVLPFLFKCKVYFCFNAKL